ncbi:MAG: alkaline phosphatase family protein [Acidimicrobiales bacterium]
MRIRLRTALVMACATALVGAGLGLSMPAFATGRPTTPAVASRRPVGPPGNGNFRGAPFPHMNHVFVIMMENTSYSDLLNASNPDTTFIQNLASTYGLATHYFGVTHTSQPNYIAAISGSTWGSNNDDPAQANDGDFNHLNLVDQLEQAHVSWKAYMESMPSAGYGGVYGDCSDPNPDPLCTNSDTGTALYVRKHDPFMLFPDISDSPQRTADVVPLTQLTTDLSDGHAPDFAWISPNICNDMHGGAPACPYANSPNDQNQMTLYKDGDEFLQQWVTAIMSSSAWTGNSAIFITWDEGSYADAAPFGPLDDSGCCDEPVLPDPPANAVTGSGGDLVGATVYGGGQVPMIVVSRRGARAMTDVTASNHYSLLQTIEQNWHLGFLGNASDTIQVHSLAPLLDPASWDNHRGRG